MHFLRRFMTNINWFDILTIKVRKRFIIYHSKLKQNFSFLNGKWVRLCLMYKLKDNLGFQHSVVFFSYKADILCSFWNAMNIVSISIFKIYMYFNYFLCVYCWTFENIFGRQFFFWLCSLWVDNFSYKQNCHFFFLRFFFHLHKFTLVVREVSAELFLSK